MDELTRCCAAVVANANFIRKEAGVQGDVDQEIAMRGRVDAINVLAAMMGVSSERVRELAEVEEARLRRICKSAA